MRAFLFSTVAGLALTTACSSGPRELKPVNSSSLCLAGERPIFSCQLRPASASPDRPGGLFQSLCVTRDLTKKRGAIFYRIGRHDLIDLSFPSRAADSRARFRWQTIGYSGGWDTRVQFRSGRRTFRLMDRAIKTSIKSKVLTRGVTIFHHNRRGRLVRTERLRCTAATRGRPYENSLNDLYGYIPEGKFFRE